MTTTTAQVSPAIYLDLWDAATKTRHTQIRLIRMEAGVWRFIAKDSGGDVNVSGPRYRTKAEALSDLTRFASWFGV